MQPFQLISAPFTPFDEAENLRLDRIAPVAAALAANGVDGVFVCGTTGENASLSDAERRLVAAEWARVRPASLRLIVHVGHNDLRTARALAVHAREIGADAIACIAPFFFRPGPEELLHYCEQIAAAAPGLPFHYYHMPSMTGVPLAMPAFVRQAAARIPNFAGVKYTHENLMEFAQLAAADPDRKLQLLFGRDEILLSALPFNPAGAVGSTYNYLAPLFRKLLAAHEAGDLARAAACQQQAVAIIDIVSRHGGLRAGKAAMHLIGLDCGPVRLPLRAPTPADLAALRRELDAVGFFEVATRA